LARNAIWNILGQTTPMAVAVFAIPRLIRVLGPARFGVLTIAWMVVGYFSFFDFGLGRALTKLVADKLGAKKENQLPQLVWTAIGAIFLLGSVGTVVLMCGSHLLVYSILKIPEAVRPETLRSFYVLAFAIPVVTTSTGLRGVLEAHQEFALLAMIRIPLGIFTFAGPVLVLLFSQSMVAIVGALLAIRVITSMAHLLACLITMPELRHTAHFETSSLQDVFHLGGWMTVSNVISPILVYMDRFLIGSVLSVTAVAYYATPFEMISKLLVIPLAMMGPLFPAFAVNSVQQDHARSRLILSRAVSYIFVAIFPIIVLTVSFAHQGLRLWLGETFAQHGASVLQLLAVGVLINCMSVVPAAMIQGYGRPDIAAKFHMLEMPLYLVALWSMLHWYGIVGAAIAWTVRVTVDAILLFITAARLSQHSFPGWHEIGAISFGVPTALLLSALPLAVVIKVPLVTVILLLFGLVAWFRFGPDHAPIRVLFRRTAPSSVKW
jgi:O-antigen/teichoic acid export membrane protein